MTYQLFARNVLEDCRTALAEFERAEPAGSLWRVQWVANIALLRTVAHVIRNVDAITEDHPNELREAAVEWWEGLRETKPEPRIFWGFIQEERNNLLKEYKFRANIGVTIEVPTAVLRRTPEGRIEQVGAKGEGKSWRDYNITGGPFKGKDQREVIRQAIEWWQDQLDDIEARAAAKKLENLRDTPG